MLSKPCGGEENENKVEREERCHYNEHRPAELVVAAAVVIQHRGHDEEVVGHVAEVENLRQQRPRAGPAEFQRHLAAEQSLLPRGHYMVEVGEHAVKLVEVGIPPCEQRELRYAPRPHGEAARNEPVGRPQGQRHQHDAHSPEYHRVGIDAAGVGEHGHQEGDGHVAKHHPFERKQSPCGLLLYPEIF